jgi:hypothetical protein
VALGEASAVLVREQLGVEVNGRWEVEGALKEELAGGGFEEVAAADYFGNLHVCVVDDAGELVAGEAVLAPDEEVAEVFARGKGLGTQANVCEGYRCAVGDTEPVVHVGFEDGWGGVGRAAVATIDRFVVSVFVGSVHHGGEVLAAACAGIDVALLEQLVEHAAVKIRAV